MLRSMQRAFYHNGENQDMSKIALCPSVPILLFGASASPKWSTERGQLSVAGTPEMSRGRLSFMSE